MRLRLLPMTMVATGMLLAVKVADVVHGGEAFTHGLIVSSVDAQTNPVPAAASSSSSSSSSSDSSTSGSTSSSSTSGSSDSGSTSGSGSSASGSSTSSDSSSTSGSSSSSDSSTSGSTSGSSSGSGSTSGSSSSSGSAEEGGKPAEKPIASSAPPSAEQQAGGKGLAPGARYFSPIELEILQTLSKRREAIDQWQKDAETKENLLANTEKRIDGKIVEIETLKKEVQAVLDKYNEQEDAKIRSLVKIYESMNPKDAARIFDEIEMPVLLMVIDKMSEKKAAPILASMDANKAKQLTVELAEERKLQTAKASTAKAPLTTAPVKAGQ